MEAGVKLNAVRVGGGVSLAEVTVRGEGNPLAGRSAGPRSRVFPATSATRTLVAVQVPASLNWGKLRVAELVTDVPAVKLGDALWLREPEGLVNTI